MITQLYEIFKKSKGVSTDSRENLQGKIFFALKGEKFDGNNFLKQAQDKGAIALVGNIDFHTEVPYFKVPDTLVTLQQLANYHRRQIRTKIVAIGGSNGKTTTKELLFQILSAKYKVYKSYGNYNNHIGVPLCLLQIAGDEDFAVLEFGDNHPGELSKLCQIAEPNDAIITNIGKDHLGEFNSLEANYNTKFELINYIKKRGGVLVLDGDDIFLRRANESYEKAFFFGTEPHNNIRVEVEFPDKVLLHYDKTYKFPVKILGLHNALNIAAAVQYSVLNGITIPQAIEIVSKFNPYKNRGEIIEKEHYKIYLDAYNANPSSMEMLLKYWFSVIPAEKIGLILGEMAELGKFSEKEHTILGEKLVELQPNFVILVGKDTVYTYEVLKNKHKSVFYYSNISELPMDLLKKLLENISVLLVKGSRVNKLEKILDYI